MELKKRKPTRANGADYSAPGAYFVTLCTKDKENILSSIYSVGDGVLDVPRVSLTPYGNIIEQRISEINHAYSDLHIEQYVIMPNHVHMIVILYDDNGTSRTPSPTENNKQRANERLSQLVSTLKRFVNKEVGKNIWQRSFNDHIIRNREDYDEVCKYIYNNPLKWLYNE